MLIDTDLTREFEALKLRFNFSISNNKSRIIVCKSC